MAPASKPFSPLLVTVTWDDPRSDHESYILDEVVTGKGVGPYLNRKTSGHLCYVNTEYIGLYSDVDDSEEPIEVGGGTAILLVLIKQIRLGQHGKIIYARV